MTLADKDAKMASTDKLTPSDTRVEHEFATLNGVKYHYLTASPSGTPKATILLIHGWPDFSFGWRYQIPFLLSQNYRVIAPDMIGYGQTEAPQDLKYYTFKRAADDMEELCRQLNIPRVVLLGHDWGGAIVYRIALWKPQLITAVIGVCTPYSRPATEFVSTEQMVATVLPQFKYQLHLASGEVEENITSREDIKNFLNSLFGARTKDGSVGLDVTKGADFDVIKSRKLVRTSLLSEEEWNHYADEFSRTGMRGTVNWYRTRKLNYEEELPLAKQEGIKVNPPTLFIGASRDVALPPKMSRGMEQNFKELQRAEVDGGHWILVQSAEQCNKIIGGFLEDIVSRDGNKSKI